MLEHDKPACSCRSYSHDTQGVILVSGFLKITSPGLDRTVRFATRHTISLACHGVDTLSVKTYSTSSRTSSHFFCVSPISTWWGSFWRALFKSVSVELFCTHTHRAHTDFMVQRDRLDQWLWSRFGMSRERSTSEEINLQKRWNYKNKCHVSAHLIIRHWAVKSPWFSGME